MAESLLKVDVKPVREMVRQRVETMISWKPTCMERFLDRVHGVVLERNGSGGRLPPEAVWTRGRASASFLVLCSCVDPSRSASVNSACSEVLGMWRWKRTALSEARARIAKKGARGDASFARATSTSAVVV